MLQNFCMELTLRLNRLVHSPKRAGYLAGIIYLNLMSFYALMGRLPVPSKVRNFLNKGSVVFLPGSRASHSPFSSFHLGQ